MGMVLLDSEHPLSWIWEKVWLAGGGMALLSHPCGTAALDHLCRQEHGSLQRSSFLSQGCV